MNADTPAPAPVLSICIATLNRGAFIGQTLDSIVSQATDEIEIVVVDGASTDHTAEVVRAYQARFPRLNYVRLDAKGGVDADYDRTVCEATGEYCWLFSDDDLLKPGAIEAVLKQLRRGYDLVIVNAEARSADLSDLQQERVLTVDEDCNYGPGEQERLFVDVTKYMTFIGCVVIRRSIWLARERSRYYGSAFIHVGVIFQAPFPGPTLLLAYPWIVIRYGNASWTARAFDIWMVQWPKLVWSFPHISATAKRSITRKEPWRSPTVLFLTRAVDGLTMDIYRQSYAPLMTSRRDRAIAQIIAWLPGVLVNSAAILAFKFFRPHDKLMQVNFHGSAHYFGNYLGRNRLCG
jgi:glycosyltransferase involved in cell wall biosynthesis